MKKIKKNSIGRRNFLKAATTVGIAASPLASSQTASQQEEPEQSTTTPPSSTQEAIELSGPSAYTDDQQAKYFVDNPGSDFMVDVIKKLGIDYIALNPGSSFRGLQESLVNYGNNTIP